MSTPSAPARLDLSGRRLELAVDGAYDHRGGFASLEVHPGWPERLRGEEDGFRCDGCPAAAWHDGPPAVWIGYAEQAAVGAEVGDWAITLCRGCAISLGAPPDGPNLPDALVHFAIARREYRAAEAGPSPAARRMKDAQLDAAGLLLGATLAPVLAQLGCDRESVRLALSDLDLTDGTIERILDDTLGPWCA